MSPEPAIDNIDKAVKDLQINLERIESQCLCHPKLSKKLQAIKQTSKKLDQNPEFKTELQGDIKMMFFQIDQIDNITDQRV